MSIDEYFGSWMQVLDKQELIRINGFLKTVYSSKHPVCPRITDVYRAFRLCSYEDLRVVFIGQDPYPQLGVATGVLFGNKPDTPEDKLSPSLQKVKDCLVSNIYPQESVIFDITLESWAKQGILMLNSALTVLCGLPNSHNMKWRPLISKLLKNLSMKRTAVIYVLFGSEARTFAPYINNKNNYVIKCRHPAYYCRIGKPMPNVFSEINNLIHKLNGDYIEFYKQVKYE